MASLACSLQGDFCERRHQCMWSLRSTEAGVVSASHFGIDARLPRRQLAAVFSWIGMEKMWDFHCSERPQAKDCTKESSRAQTSTQVLSGKVDFKESSWNTKLPWLSKIDVRTSTSFHGWCLAKPLADFWQALTNPFSERWRTCVCAGEEVLYNWNWSNPYFPLGKQYVLNGFFRGFPNISSFQSLLFIVKSPMCHVMLKVSFVIYIQSR